MMHSFQAKADVEQANKGRHDFDEVKHCLEQQKNELANQLNKLESEKVTLGKQIEKVSLLTKLRSCIIYSAVSACCRYHIPPEYHIPAI